MMSTARLKEIYKQEQNHRKFVCVMNDLAKSQQEMYEGLLDKEKHEAEQRNQKSIVMTRRNVVRQRVLQKCMKTTREAAEQHQQATSDDKYGRYNGVCVEQIAENIDSFLEQDHPRVRRQRKINELFVKGYARGAILQDETAHQKVNDYFKRPLVEIYRGTEKEKTANRKERTTFLPPLASGFYTGDVTNDWAICKPEISVSENDARGKAAGFAHRKKSKFLEEDVPDNLSIQSELPILTVTPKTSSKLRPITLPPRKVGTDNSTADGKPKTDGISDLIARLKRAKDMRERETKLRKEKRAKRLQAERVYGYGRQDEEAGTEEVTGHLLFVEGLGRGKDNKDHTSTGSTAKTPSLLPPLKLKTSSYLK